MGTVTKAFDDRLANRPFLVFDFLALWRSGFRQSARKSKQKPVGYSAWREIPKLV